MMEKKLSLTDRICITLFKEQLEYINGDSKLLRRKIFNALVSRTVIQTTDIKDKRYHVTLQQGQCLISEVELAELAGCNRKTVHSILTEFEQMGISTSVSVQQRTSIHTMYCIMSWRTEAGFLYNKFFEKRATDVLVRVAAQNEDRERKSVEKKAKKEDLSTSLNFPCETDKDNKPINSIETGNVSSASCPSSSGSHATVEDINEVYPSCPKQETSDEKLNA